MQPTPDQLSRVHEIADHFSLDLVILFGSRSTDRVHNDSDTDIAVKARRTITLEEKLEIGAALDQVFPEVDLCDLRAAPPLLAVAVANDGQLLFERKALSFEQFKIFARNQYIEFKPFFDQLRKNNAERIKRL